jgi:hypothetical protein
MDIQSTFGFINKHGSASKPPSDTEQHVALPRQKPIVCPVCSWVCTIEESGYSGGIDHEPIHCENCQTLVIQYRTTRHTTKTWRPPLQQA